MSNLSPILLLLLPFLFIGTYASTSGSDGGFSLGLGAGFDGPAASPSNSDGWDDGDDHHSSKKHDSSESDESQSVSPGPDAAGAASAQFNPRFETKFLGEWKIHNKNAGVAAMQLQLMPTNKVVWFDTTNLGPSALLFDPPFCRKTPNPNNASATDCYAHAIEYDSETGHVRPLKLMSDPWCSCGGLAPNGELLNIGGALEALRAVRLYESCDDCDFRENIVATAEHRWYSSQHILEDGSFAVFGGRDVFSYEIVPSNKLNFKPKLFQLPFLKETRDEVENNLYPFLYLLPDGNLFLFANSKSIIIDPQTGKIIRNLPDLPGGSRNYPASAMSVLFPLDLSRENIRLEVMVCGGNTHDALKFSEFEPRKFIPALKDCNRLVISEEHPAWHREDMPSPRVMGDALLLPTGDVLMLNGAKAGTSAWEAADDANLTPLLYRPKNKKGQRFTELQPTTIARMYHSASALLVDGSVLVAGSNPHQFYTFKAKYPTELRVEKFSPPYLDPELDQHRPQIAEDSSDKELSYGKNFAVKFKLDDEVGQADIKVAMYPPPFTTHGFSQSQRLLILKVNKVSNQQVTAAAPQSATIAPPGYYMLFVVHRGVPSKGMWVHIM